MSILTYKKIISEMGKYNFNSFSNLQLLNFSKSIREDIGILNEDTVIIMAAAVVKECIKRALGINLFDVQIIAGLAMYSGKIIQMNTGEGKTVSAVLPAFINCLYGKKVHILTFNDYLAGRDADWMRPVFERLGISVDCVQENMSKAQRKKSYSRDVVYISAKEAGFDFLRDALAYKMEDMVQQTLETAIVDEADSILIDEARIPLVIADTSEDYERDIIKAVEVVSDMEGGVHYKIDENCRNVYFTESGEVLIEKVFSYKNLYDKENIHSLIQLNNALYAVVLLKKDIHYIIKDGKIGIVDDFTGRVIENRHWPDCLQAAVETKEGLEVSPRGRVMNSITIQNFINLYNKVSGMTGTAEFSKDEFRSYYGLEVEVIPTNIPCTRKDFNDFVFTHIEAKYAAIVDEVLKWHQIGRPILIGTGNIKESETISKLLGNKGVSSSILNAKNNYQEAKIIAEAGKLGAVTVSTNMAGRGVDIKLGGSDESEKEEVIRLGGLYVIGTTRHECRRIDFQLRGRAGRQGEPGETRFFISLEDDILMQYGIEKIIGNKPLKKQMTPIQNKKIINKVSQVQRIIEGQNYEIRRTLWNYSVIAQSQRKIIDKKRRAVLERNSELEIFSKRCTKKYQEIIKSCKKEEVIRIEKGIMIYCIDQYWSNYLDMISYIKDGIYLLNIGGQNPLDSFNREIINAFEDMNRDIEEKAVKLFEGLEINGNKLIYDEWIIKGPSSTWTYLIDDNPFSDDLGVLLTNPKNTGFGVLAAILFGPLLIGSLIYQRFFKKNKLLE